MLSLGDDLADVDMGCGQIHILPAQTSPRRIPANRANKNGAPQRSAATALANWNASGAVKL
ncbi:hypothetical protein [Deinococcus arenicola]|uniref:Uncharacterized protein n=1 Tax=Deinococcus arenicola TaxID=2994950 RepID=A0ABU4DRQ6_9DEIO|nr:hypothetical protein [Deinococcus sp. ZS9-10]MDV6375122.1 hypothetical protein [Deinococcus sp. ZS9-10]